MIELVICNHIRNGYKVVLPKNLIYRVSAQYGRSIYKYPSEVNPGDKLKFIGWVSANDEDRLVWKNYL